MRVGELGGDVELEVGVVVDLFVAQLDQRLVAALDERFGEHRLQHWVHLLQDVLHKRALRISTLLSCPCIVAAAAQRLHRRSASTAQLCGHKRHHLLRPPAVPHVMSDIRRKGSTS